MGLYLDLAKAGLQNDWAQWVNNRFANRPYFVEKADI